MFRRVLFAPLLCGLFLIAPISAEEPEKSASRHAEFFKFECSATNDCLVIYRGKKVLRLESLTPDGPNLRFIRAGRHRGEIFLIQYSRSDGCPSEYRVIEVGPASAHVSPTFGNCNETTVKLEKDYIRFNFSGLAEADRKSKAYIYRNRSLRSIAVGGTR